MSVGPKTNTSFCVISGILLASLFFTPYARAIEFVISDNGGSSENEISTQVESESTVVQSNEVEVSNSVDVETNTGDNSISGSNSDETTIETGDVSSEVVVESSVNSSSIEEEVCCESNDAIGVISNNGSGSQNIIDLKVIKETEVIVEQASSITNDVSGSANTGNNQVNSSSGNVSMKTGDITVIGEIESSVINSTNVDRGVGRSNVSVGISENGNESNNFVSFALSNSNGIKVTENADVDNSVSWDVNTGGNKVNDSLDDVEVKTGDILFEFFIKNGPVNISSVSLLCCSVYDPKDPSSSSGPADPSDPVDPTNTGENDNPGEEGIGYGGNSNDEGDNNSSNSEVQGTLLSQAATTSTPSIIGLSDTSSEAASTLLFWVGLAMISLGLKFIGDNLSSNRLAKEKLRQ